MRILIAIGLAGLLGCASPGLRGPVVTETAHVEEPQRGFPAWVEVPAWMAEESREDRSEVDANPPIVSVLCSVYTWSAQVPGMPVFSQDGYAILGDGEADRIMARLESHYSSTKLSSPSVIVRLGESASIAVMSSARRKDRPRSGVVFFTRPTTIDNQGVDLRFSFQLAAYDSRDSDNSARPRLGSAKLEGHAKLGIGQWYVRAFEGDYPLAAGTEMALFIQIGRVDYPEAPVAETVAVVSSAGRLAE